MRYRQLDTDNDGDNGDYTIGLPFLMNSPQCVAQAVLTRLKLWRGEWFLDTTDGVPYLQNILGKHYGSNPDAFIKQRILGTQGVSALVAYNSSFNGATRQFTVTATIDTVYGVTQITTTF